MKYFLLIIIAASNFCFAQESPQREYSPTSIYPEGRLEIGALGIGTKYLGEFTDETVGLAGGIVTRYTFPFLPEFSIGARYTKGTIDYSRRSKARFSGNFQEQFPVSYYGSEPLRRKTDFNEIGFSAYLNLFPRHELNYYLMAGMSALIFMPQDIEEDPIGSNGRRKHFSEFTIDKVFFDVHPMFGLGIDYFPAKTFSVGLQSIFHLNNTDYLDAFASNDDESNMPTLPDAYAELGIKASYYFFTDNDIDRDGLANSEEEKFGTNPYNADSDDDEITDFDEAKIYHSNPLVADTDSDGLSDGEEIMMFHTSAGSQDSDSDGIIDFDEVRLYKTNPGNPDSDNDQLGDLAELNKGSNPLNGDSDSDSISDYGDDCPNIFGVKDRNGCPEPPYPPSQHLYTGNIQPEITKHDTVYIAREVADLKQKEIYTFYGINFETNSADIRVESEIILDDVVKWLKSHPEFLVEIQGHTDSDGSENANTKLSEQRANSVREFLVRNGISSSQLTAVGFGEFNPVVSNDSPKGKARNRRIEFHVKQNSILSEQNR